MTICRDINGRGSDPRRKVLSSVIAHDSYVGVEVELEGMASSAMDVQPRYWSVKGDGSLYDRGLEFVMVTPLCGEDIVEALKELQYVLSPYDPIASERTSIHVHVDARDITMEEFRRWLSLYYLFEDTFFEYFGADRKDNPFCLAGSVTPAYISHLARNLDSGTISDVLHSEGICKYTSANLQALHDFGSIEFRGHRGTYDIDEILRWVNMLLSIKKAAVEWTDEVMRETVGSFSNAALLRRVFGNEIASHLMYLSGMSDAMGRGRKMYRTFTDAGLSSHIPEHEEVPEQGAHTITDGRTVNAGWTSTGSPEFVRLASEFMRENPPPPGLDPEDTYTYTTSNTTF